MLLYYKKFQKYFLFLFFIINFNFAYATQPKICMVLDVGGKNDKSFNQSAVEGFNQALESLAIAKDSKFLETHSDEQIQHFLRAFSVDPNCKLIISVGFNPSSYVKALAEKYVDKKYLAIDAEIVSSKKNVRSAIFREDQGAFLMGSIAAMKSTTKKVAMIGGMDIPMMKRFAFAYEAGVKHISSKIEVIHTVVGAKADAWNNPTKAKEIAVSLLKQGVDVIFQVAGPSGQGVFEAIKQRNTEQEKNKVNSESMGRCYAIGVDSNQNAIVPGAVITSMLKHIDIAVYMAIKDIVEERYTAEVKSFDLRNGGIDLAYDKYNRSLFSGFEIRKINKIRAEIIDGKIKVPDYYELSKKSASKI